MNHLEETPSLSEMLAIYAAPRYDPRHDLILTHGHLIPEYTTTWGQVLEFAVRQHLRSFDWLFHENSAVVMRLIENDVRTHGDMLADHVANRSELEQPQLTLGFTDRVWVTLSRWEQFHHVKSGEMARHLGSLRPLELTTVDLTTLWMRHRERIKDGRSKLRRAAEVRQSEAAEDAAASSTSSG